MPLKILKLLFLFAAFLFAFNDIAYSHPPYAIKQKVITDPDNQNLIIEKLYGDGIIVSDPVLLQIRNSKGAIIASSPVSDNISYFCPFLSNCWIFPYSSFSLFSKGYKLDSENLDYKKELPKENQFQETRNEFESYLKDNNNKMFQSYELQYPELNDFKPYGFSYTPLSYIGSPFAIIFDKIIMYFFITLTIFLQIRLSRGIFNSILKTDRTSSTKSLLSIATYILITFFVVIDLTAIFITIFVASIPILYLIASIGLGIFVARKKATPNQGTAFSEPL